MMTEDAALALSRVVATARPSVIRGRSRMSLFDCEPTLSGVRIREELEKLVYGRPAHDAAMPTDEAEARRYPRDRENF
jgi:hypothetical protein